MQHMTLCENDGTDDIFRARRYIFKPDGSVIRFCYPFGCRMAIRQRISSEQAAREIAVLSAEQSVTIIEGEH